MAARAPSMCGSSDRLVVTEPQETLAIVVRRSDSFSNSERAEIVDLCTEAYGETFGDYLDQLSDPTHVLAVRGDRFVAHGCWVTRWLQPGDGPSLRTAYVEAVATRPSEAGRGHATAIMARILASVEVFDIAALSPAIEGFYERLAWERWRGPLFVRRDSKTLPADDDACMIHRLPRTPQLDLDGPLSIEWRPGEVW